jgi:hypothetical protein
MLTFPGEGALVTLDCSAELPEIEAPHSLFVRAVDLKECSLLICCMRHMQAVRLGQEGTSIAVAVGGGLMVVDVQPQPATLAAAIGKLSIGQSGDLARRAFSVEGDKFSSRPRYSHTQIPWLQPGAMSPLEPDHDDRSTHLAVPLVLK